MWLVICEEYNEDPVYLSLVPFASLSARRLTMLVFRPGRGQGRREVLRQPLRHRGPLPDRLEGQRGGPVAGPGQGRQGARSQADRHQRGGRLRLRRRPQRVQEKAPRPGPRPGIREKARRGRAAGRGLARAPAARGDRGLSPHLRHRPRRHRRGVLERGHHAGRDDDGRTSSGGSGRSSGPSARRPGSIPASPSSGRPSSPYKDSPVIHRGDLLHCDIGINYLRLNTDTQQHAYVLHAGRDRRAPGPEGRPGPRATASRTSSSAR